VPPGAGLYFLTDVGSQEIIYIGQSNNCQNRLLDHSRKSWVEKDVFLSYFILEKPVPAHNLKELENDLIGNYFEVYRKAPGYQFRNQG
jgi:hypothetical protein